jgi:hypothetical protein
MKEITTYEIGPKELKAALILYLQQRGVDVTNADINVAIYKTNADDSSRRCTVSVIRGEPE